MSAGVTKLERDARRQDRECRDPLPSPATLNVLDFTDMMKLLKVSRAGLYRLIDSGRVPTPMRLGRLARWDGRVIEAWLSSGMPRTPRKARGGTP